MSRKFTIAALIVLCAVMLEQAIAQPAWIQLSTPTTRTLNKVYFLDSLIGWAAGDSGTILKTTNGGLNWVVQDPGIQSGINNFFMLNEHNGWALSVTPWSQSGGWYGTTLLATTDGGENWTSREFDSLILYALCFTDSLHGWVGGDAGTFLRTSDGGDHWTPAKVEPSVISHLPVKCMKFISPAVGFATGGRPEGNGVVWRTTDAGEFWATTRVGNDQLSAFQARDSLNIVAVGGGYDEGAVGAATSDGGETWSCRYLAIAGLGYSLSFRTPAEAWTTLGPAMACMYSLDSGMTWTRTIVMKGIYFYDVMFTDPRHGYMVGTKGTVLKFNTSFSLSVFPQWNILSLPVALPESRKSVLFPSAISNAFAFAPGGYRLSDSLEPGVGYWLKFPDAETFFVKGIPLFTDSIALNQGWNLIGTVSAPVPVFDVATIGTTIISDFFRYDKGYLRADTLFPGRGYWVKVNREGRLILSSGF